MKRRLFLLSGSTSVAAAVTGCGGGGSEGGATALSEASTAGSLSASANVPVVLQQTTSLATPAVAYPFGARLARYVAGIRPTQSNQAMDDVLTRQYDAWKAARVVPASFIVAGGYAVRFNNPNFLAVSEGMGYGMLLTVLFAGHDPQAQALFDGMLAVVRARPAYGFAPFGPNGQYLMDWQLYSNGASAGGGWNAMDGDLDIALALLMANKQWGSAGKWNYLQEGKNTIAGLKTWNMKTDGATKGLPDANNNRTSDYMIGHFRAFKAATGDALWDLAVGRAYSLIDRMQTVYSPGVGLMPDFVMHTETATPYPSTGFIGDGNDKEGYYWWNACRNPWRYATDYLMSGDSRFSLVTGRMIDFFKAKSGGNPFNIGTGYALNGTMLTGGNSGAYHGPICAGACVDARFQTFLDAMWNWNVSHLSTGYYEAELQLLSLVVASGNWWTPASSTTTTAAPPPPAPSPPPPPPPPPPTGSILVNGDFANGLTNWDNWGNSSVANGSLQVGTAAGGVGQNITGKLTPGAKYRLTGAASITSSAEGVFVGVKLMDSAWGVLANPVQLVNSLTPAGVSVSFTVPPGVANAWIFVWKNANGALGVVDNLALVAVA